MFGLLRMCQLVLPGMRGQGWGKIVNIGSMGGRLTFPGGGLYHATKYAIEAISDAMRFEVKGFGVDVILIEPGLITTNFGDVSTGSVDEGGEDGPTPSSTAGWPRRPKTRTRVRCPSSAAGRRAWPGRSPRRSRPAGRGPAIRSPRARI